MIADPRLPVVGVYRGVDLHDFQTPERISTLVKPAIDFVYGVDEPNDLFDYACSAAHPPEARILAAARLTAISEQRADKRLPRPGLDPDRIKAAVAGLDSHWADPDFYCSLLDTIRRRDIAAPRPPEFGRQLEEYFRNAERNRLLAAGWVLDPVGNGKLMPPGRS